jgi:hypothetical protein
MFYHSTEPRHLHYHPIEAIYAGMPLIYMKPSLLYSFSQPDTVAACDTFPEAREKILSILDGNTAFINRVRKENQYILEAFSTSHYIQHWNQKISKILT